MVIGKSNKLVIEQPSPIRKQVYEHLRDQILENIIEPGSRLVEAQIAKALGISRTPVREALHILEKDGFIDSIPRVGYRVRELVLDELEEIFEIRKVNELLACSWAIRKITPETIKALEKNLKLTAQALKNDQPETFLELDQEFHEMLVLASGSQHLTDLCQQLRRLMLRYRMDSIKSTETVEKALKGHTAILNALKEKDEKALMDALVSHLHYSKLDIQEKGKSDS
ncbi:GntR family transcriptional regulator [Desulfocicer niacini]